MWIHWPFFPKTWTKGHWPLDDLWPHVCWGHMCDSTKASLCPSPMTIHQCMWIQWSILQNTTYIHIHTTYYVQNEWSHSLLLNSVQARQKTSWRAKSKTSVFATDGIWLTFSVVLNFLLLGWTPWVGFQNEQLMCFHNRQKRNGHSLTCCYSNTICKCDGQNRLFHFFPSVAFQRLCYHSNAFNCGSIFSLSYWSMLIVLLCSILSV